MACRCRHPHDLHEHYRPGTDCALCDCPAYRPAPETTVWTWLRSHLLRDVMTELASIKSIALNTRAALDDAVLAAERDRARAARAADGTAPD